MGSEARSLLMDEAVSLGRVVMVVILEDDGRNSFRGTAFHEFDPGMDCTGCLMLRDFSPYC